MKLQFKLLILFIMLITLSSFVTASDLEADLQFYFDGTDFDDKSGNGIIITNNGVSIVDDTFRFDGSSDYMKIPSTTTDNLNAGTLCIDFKFDDEAVGYNIFGKDSANFRSQFSSSFDDSYFQVKGEGSMYSDEDLDWTTTQLTCFWWNGVSKKMYISGSEVVTSFTSVNSPSSGDLFFGHNSVNTNELLKGNIASISFWDRALTQTELTDLNTANGNPLTPPPPTNVYTERAFTDYQLNDVSFVTQNTYYEILTASVQNNNENATGYIDVEVQMDSIQNVDVTCKVEVNNNLVMEDTRTNLAQTYGFYPYYLKSWSSNNFKNTI